MNQPADAERTSAWKRTVASAWPAMIPLALGATYYLSPRFYLTYILEVRRREFQFVEMATEIFALSAAVMLLVAGGRAWRSGTEARRSGRVPAKRWLDGRGGAAIILFLAAACLFLAAEEASWGQKYFGWESELRETNLHNTVPISFAGLGSIVIVLLLVGIPIAWRFRDRLPVPRDWEPAVAEGPVIVCLLLAFVMSWIKDIALLTIDDPQQSRVYIGYFEQLNEKKEMMLALSLMLYGVYRLRKTGPRKWDQTRAAETLAAPEMESGVLGRKP